MIKLNNITTGYEKNYPLKQDFHYTFEGNKIYGILGESGCGKTTLLRTIAGLTKPLSGEIKLECSQKEIYMMHQNYTSFNWLTCLDNILITERIKHKRITDVKRDRAVKLLESVGLSGYEDKYPMELSGGMRQRLALARTLYTEPKVILMDEPLSALDDETRKKMQDLILDIHRITKNTIIMVTHSPKEADYMCDIILNF